ncbi:MAG: hypothetical protein ABEI78_00015, partial [Candidatus Nanohaloarchaea archaeon]
MKKFSGKKSALIIVILLLIPISSAISPLEILIVDDGHTLKNDKYYNQERTHQKYLNALNGIKNAKITIKTIKQGGTGPSASTMDKYDIIIWYTLQDFEGQPGCQNCITLNNKDRNNISNYLNNKRGRIFVNGHQLTSDLATQTDFLRQKFGITLSEYGATPEYWRCNIKAEKCQTQVNKTKEILYSTSDKTIRLIGESNDPITPNSFSTYLNTTLEPPESRGVIVDKCNYETQGQILDVELEEISTDSPPGCSSGFNADDSLRYMDDSGAKKYFFEEDENLEATDDYTHALVHTSAQKYKSVFTSFGFESIRKKEKRKRFMENLIHYLSGPRVKNFKASDGDDLPGTQVNESHYVNNTIDLSGTCRNYQINTNTAITDAEWDHTKKNEFPTPRKANGDHSVNNNGGYDDNDPDKEYVYQDNWNAGSNLNSQPGGTKYLFGIHCKDNRYWGQFATQKIIVDTQEPTKPLLFNTTQNYVSKEHIKTFLDYDVGVKSIDPGGRPDLVKFSKINCYTEGNHTLQMKIRDYAGNSPSLIEDWIVVDKTQPQFKDALPNNNSFIQKNDPLQLNYTDNFGINQGNEAPNNTFNNGTTNQTFIPNKTFEGDYTSTGEQSLFTWVYDLASNLKQMYFKYIVDMKAPKLEKIKPNNNSYITSQETLTINLTDNRKFK